MGERYLIINADDFGMCRETNSAIEELFKRGRITSAAVMAPAEFVKEAVHTAVNNGFDLGLHVTLNSDWKYSPWKCTASVTKVSSLIDKNGTFYSKVSDFYEKAKENEVAAEINAQYDFIVGLGYKPTHMDSHCGTLYGLGGRSFLKQAFQVCKEYKLPFRFPKSKDFLTDMFKGNVPKAIEEAHSGAVMAAEAFGISLLDYMITNPFSVKDLGSYDSLKGFYINSIKNLKEGVTELFLHPSYDVAMLSSISSEWQKRIWERELLLDEDFQKVLYDERINLVSWKEAPFDKNYV
jgi:chitin disaccharide deacetylase